MSLFAVGAAAGEATPSAKAWQDEFSLVDRQVYASLERAPARGWVGWDSGWAPLYAVRNKLAADNADVSQLTQTAPGQLAAAYEAILKLLRLEPVGTIGMDATGAATAEPAALEVVAYADVPTAVVLWLAPAGMDGTLAIAAQGGERFTIEGQDLRLSRRFGQYAVLPLTAKGAAGKCSVGLKLSTGGKETLVPLTVEVRPSGTLTGQVHRKGDGAALDAKLFIEDQAGRLFVAPGARNYTTQNWYAPWQPRFTLVSDTFTIPLPPGEYRLTVMKGFGYRDWEGTIAVQPGQATHARVEMTSLRELEEQGWFCGDMHMHGTSPLAMLRAEDVNVVANTFYSSKNAIPFPSYPKASDATHLNVAHQEIEHWNFGNAFYFLLPASVVDPPGGKPEMTPMFYYDEQAHKMGGVTMRYMRTRPFAAQGLGQQQPELAVNLALGQLDVWSVLENSMQNLLGAPQAKWNGDGWGEANGIYLNTYKTWYAFQNCGLRIPVAAGTSYGRLSRLGFNRVYARANGPLTAQSWAEALKRGDGFVTNGPLLWLRASEKLPGDGLALGGPGKVTLTIELVSARPVRLVELLQNGQVVATKEVTDAATLLTWEYQTDVRQPCWFAARCFGESPVRYPHMVSPNQFAHTNALVVTVGGKKPASTADAARFVKEIDALIGFAPQIPSEELRARALEMYTKAREYYAAMAGN